MQYAERDTNLRNNNKTKHTKSGNKKLRIFFNNNKIINEMEKCDGNVDPEQWYGINRGE